MDGRKLSRVGDCPPVNIEFENLSYTVAENGFKAGTKQILRSINGKFSAGNLTGILGCSGAGKSTLLNILAGYVTKGVTGKIAVNNSPRNRVFNKISAYIMQDDLIQPLLTVKELMMISANLKLSPETSPEEKEIVVTEVIKTIGLISSIDTRTEDLSGGQRKRLSIALELVNNPPVIFLDEPTTGLDNVAMKQCIEVLKFLTNQGRTIVCTIHQPSDSLFHLFDQVYFMAEGCCVYNGPTQLIIPFLSSAGFYCPTTYSPADYIIELTHINPDNIMTLVSKVKNIKTYSDSDISMADLKCKYLPIEPVDESKHNFPISFWMQVNILMKRNFLQTWRNRTSLAMQIFHHIFSAVLLGIIFYAVGNDASMIFANFKFCISVMIFFVYTYVMGPALVYPNEVKIIEREYFNRWYSLKAYYTAISITPLPSMILLGYLFITIIYTMTSQPMEWQRYALFSFAAILTGINSYGYGLAVGSILNTRNGSFFAPASVAPLAIISIYGMGYGQAIHPIMKVVIHLSFLRYGLVSLCDALYNDREDLECLDELYCHYSDPDKFMRDIGMDGTSYSIQILGMIGFTILHRYLAYVFLRYRLTQELSNGFFIYISNLMKLL